MREFAKALNRELCNELRYDVIRPLCVVVVGIIRASKTLFPMHKTNRDNFITLRGGDVSPDTFFDPIRSRYLIRMFISKAELRVWSDASRRKFCEARKIPSIPSFSFSLSHTRTRIYTSSLFSFFVFVFLSLSFNASFV